MKGLKCLKVIKLIGNCRVACILVITIKRDFNIRISGQDVERGTFSHRHAIVKTVNSETQINILENLKKCEGVFKIYNSFLSEYAVLGFDYGYSLVDPNQLVIWEAQFGRF